MKGGYGKVYAYFDEVEGVRVKKILKKNIFDGLKYEKQDIDAKGLAREMHSSEHSIQKRIHQIFEICS